MNRAEAAPIFDGGCPAQRGRQCTQGQYIDSPIDILKIAVVHVAPVVDGLKLAMLDDY